jgi:hypothetical protein
MNETSSRVYASLKSIVTHIGDTSNTRPLFSPRDIVPHTLGSVHILVNTVGFISCTLLFS